MEVQTHRGLFTVREAIVTDLPALVDIHVASWNATYPGYYPKPSRQLRTAQWQRAFDTREDGWFCFVAEQKNGPLVGFATGSRFEDAGLPYKGQLHKIHFLKAYHRLGLGRLLVGHVARRLLDSGITSMILFADAGNPHIAFYDRLQGERLYNRDGRFHGGYGWMDLQALAERCMPSHG